MLVRHAAKRAQHTHRHTDAIKIFYCVVAPLTLTVPSEEALMMWWPSGVKVASFTNEEWPRNSLRVLPDFSPWILWQKEGINACSQNDPKKYVW